MLEKGIDEFRYEIIGFLDYHNNLEYVYNSGEFICVGIKMGKRQTLQFKGLPLGKFPNLKVLKTFGYHRIEFVHKNLKNLYEVKPKLETLETNQSRNMKTPYIDLESEIMRKLEEAYNLFNNLEVTYPSYNTDFAKGIHNCQDVIIRRIVQRDYPSEFFYL